MKNYIKILLTSSIILLLGACQKEEAIVLKSMETIYKEEGIPVRIREVEEENFSTYLTFTSSLKGVKESIGTSLVSDTVEEVLVEVGDYVQKDQTIIRFPKDNPSIKYYQAKAGYEAAEQGFKRIENMYNNNGVSRQNYDDARTQFNVQRANWEAVQDLVEVKAPISGHITRMNVTPSENVRQGTGLFTISNYDQLTSTIWVGDHEINKIEKGQKVTAHWEDISIQGTVTQVDLSKDPMRKAFAIKVQLDNSGNNVPSGITAKIDIETNMIEDSIVLHRKEILSNNENSFVYLEENGHVVKRDVELGERQGMYYRINSGLNQNDKIITEGLTLVRENSLVKIIEGQNKPLALK